MNKYATALKEMQEHNPPIVVGRTWVAMLEDNVVGRRIRILGLYPPREGREEKLWIYEEMPGGKLKTDTYRIGLCPEVNLRIVFKPEVSND